MHSKFEIEMAPIFCSTFGKFDIPKCCCTNTGNDRKELLNQVGFSNVTEI